MDNQPKYSKFYLQRYPNRQNYFIKDAVHGEINFLHDQLWIYDLLNTPEMQRLAKIMQLSLSFNNFPTATHTRFAHSLGTYEVCNRAIKELIQNQFLDPQDHETKIAIKIALASALLHDVGHGPHSHAFESYLQFNHEKFGEYIINSPLSKVNAILQAQAIHDGLKANYYAEAISSIINKKNQQKKYRWAQDLVSSQIDCDRLDYLMRDGYFSGLNYTRMDFLIKWLVIIGKGNIPCNDSQSNYDLHIGFSDKAKLLIFNFLTTRLEMYADLYLNNYSVAYETVVGLMLKRMQYLYLKQRNLLPWDKYHFLYELIIPFFDPINQSEFNYENFLKLTDESFNMILTSFCEAQDPVLRSLANLFHGKIDLSEHKLIKLSSQEIHQHLQNFQLKFNKPIEDFDLVEINTEEKQLYDDNCPILLYNDDSQSVFQLEKYLPEIIWNDLQKSKSIINKKKIVIISKKLQRLIEEGAI